MNNMNMINKRVITVLVAVLFSLSINLAAQEKAADSKKTEAKPLSKEEQIRNLDSSDQKKQIDALKYVAKNEVKEALPKVGNLLSNAQSYEVRGQAASTLSFLKDKEKANPFLSKAIQNDESSYVRYMSVLAVIRLGDEKAVKALEYAHQNETDPDVKDVVTKVLIKFGKLKKPENTKQENQ